MKEKKKSEQGFTLAELLIAIVVMSIALGAVWCVFSIQLNGWIGIKNRVNALQAAIDGTDFMFNELTGYAATVTSSLGTETNYLTFIATNTLSGMIRYYEYSPDELRRDVNGTGQNLITDHIASITYLATQVVETFGNAATDASSIINYIQTNPSSDIYYDDSSSEIVMATETDNSSNYDRTSDMLQALYAFGDAIHDKSVEPHIEPYSWLDYFADIVMLEVFYLFPTPGSVDFPFNRSDNVTTFTIRDVRSTWSGPIEEQHRFNEIAFANYVTHREEIDNESSSASTDRERAHVIFDLFGFIFYGNDWYTIGTNPLFNRFYLYIRAFNLFIPAEVDALLNTFQNFVIPFWDGTVQEVISSMQEGVPRIEVYQYVESDATYTWRSYSGHPLFYNMKMGVTLRPH